MVVTYDDQRTNQRDLVDYYKLKDMKQAGELTEKDIAYVPNEKHVRGYANLLQGRPTTKIVMAHVNGENDNSRGRIPKKAPISQILADQFSNQIDYLFKPTVGDIVTIKKTFTVFNQGCRDTLRAGPQQYHVCAVNVGNSQRFLIERIGTNKRFTLKPEHEVNLHCESNKLQYVRKCLEASENMLSLFTNSEA